MIRTSIKIRIFLLLVLTSVQLISHANSDVKNKNQALQYTIDILIPKPLEPFNELQKKIEEQNKDLGIKVSLITKIQNKKRQNKSILITVNSTISVASQETLNYDAVIAFYVSPKKFRESLNNFREHNPTLPITAIYSSPPINRQLRLIQAIVPHKKNIGILYSPENKAFARQIKNQANSLGFNPILQESSNPKIFPKDVALLLRRSDVLLAHKELGTYDPQSIRIILLSAYRQRKPVFGLSAAYIKAGVLATTHSDADQLSLEISKHIQFFSKTGALFSPNYSQLFNICTNEQVSTSLGIITQDQDTIKNNINQAEKPQ